MLTHIIHHVYCSIHISHHRWFKIINYRKFFLSFVLIPTLLLENGYSSIPKLSKIGELFLNPDIVFTEKHKKKHYCKTKILHQSETILVSYYFVGFIVFLYVRVLSMGVFVIDDLYFMLRYIFIIFRQRLSQQTV